MSTVQDQHIRWIDLMRVMAISAVMLCHASEIRYELADLNYLPSRCFVFVCHVIGRLGVPLFMMISGYLLLDREYDEAAVKRFWTRKWLKLLACIGIWLVIYEIFLFAVGRGTADPLKIVQELTFTSKIDLSQTWYLGTILGVYALIPLVAVALRKFGSKILVFPFILFFSYSFVYATVNSLLLVYRPDLMLESRFDLAFSGGVWGLYLVTGYLLKKGILKKTGNILLLTGFLASSLMAFMYMLIPSFDGFINNSFIWYDNVFIYFSSLFCFELISRTENIGGKFYSAVRFVAKYAFPVFLTHIIFMLSLEPLLDPLGMPGSVKTLMLFISGFAGGLVLSKLLSMIPKAGSYITYVKE